MTDALGRVDITPEQKQRIHDALNLIPEGKRAAILLIADTETGVVRGTWAANLGGGWKVAAGGGFILEDRKPAGWVAVSRVW